MISTPAFSLYLGSEGCGVGVEGVVWVWRVWCGCGGCGWVWRVWCGVEGVVWVCGVDGCGEWVAGTVGVKLLGSTNV